MEESKSSEDAMTDRPGRETPSAGELPAADDFPAAQEAPAADEAPAVDEPVPDRLSHVVDDTDGRDEAVPWAANRLIAGASFEDVSAELVTLGWSAVAAESIVEEAREATRRERGVRTREDVMVGVSRKFGKTLRRVRWLIIIGIIVMAVVISMMFRSAE